MISKASDNMKNEDSFVHVEITEVANPTCSTYTCCVLYCMLIARRLGSWFVVNSQ